MLLSPTHPRGDLKGKIIPWYQRGIKSYAERFFPAPTSLNFSRNPGAGRAPPYSWLSPLLPSPPHPGAYQHKPTVITFQTDAIRHSIRELMHRVAKATGTLGLTRLHLKA